MGKADLGKGYWNPEMTQEVTLHFSDIKLLSLNLRENAKCQIRILTFFGIIFKLLINSYL